MVMAGLDIGGTEVAGIDQQLGQHRSGYYDHYIFLTLFVFCGIIQEIAQ